MIRASVLCCVAVASCLAVPSVGVRAQDPGLELPPGIDLNYEPAPSSAPGVPAPGSWEPEPVLPPGAVPGETAVPENPLDEVFGSALEAYRGKDYPTARDLWRELTDAGHELSTHNLAVLLWRGQGGPMDQAEAVDLFQTAEDLQVGPSAHALGVIHLRGLGVPRDPAKAMQHFEAGSRLGHGPSTYNLALAHFNGIGVRKDPALGMELMVAAAEGGLTRAEYDLATLLVQGTYGAPDPVQARDWYAKAARGADAYAHYNLGLMLLDGVGGARDIKAGTGHIRTAAEAGVVAAQRQLGFLYAEKGKAADYQAAMGWFLVAAALGDETSKTNATRLRPRLDKASNDKARQWAAKFRPVTLVAEKVPDSAQ